MPGVSELAREEAEYAQAAYGPVEMPGTAGGARRSTTADAIKRVCAEVEAMLLAKNAQYGDSATNPVRVFSRASTDEQLRVRIDDKLSRLARGDACMDDDDVVLDLIGYLVLLRVTRL